VLSPGLIAGIAAGVIVLLVLIWFAMTFNRLVRQRNQVRAAWAQTDVQLKRRYDLIPNLVETVKGYAAHERGTLDEVVRARSQAVQAQGVQAQARAESDLTGALGRLMVVMEQYPNLKADQNFRGLQEELASTENRIGFSRQAYNDAVMEYNSRIQSFPANLLAGPFSFREEIFFEIAEQDRAQREVPQVKFTQPT